MARWAILRILFVVAGVGISSCLPPASAQEPAGVDAGTATAKDAGRKAKDAAVKGKPGTEAADKLNEDLEALKNELTGPADAG